MDRARRAGLLAAILGAPGLLGGCVSAAWQAASAGVGPRSAPVTAQAASGITERTVTFVDHSRTIRYPQHPAQPRPLATVIRLPPHAAGPLPLIVFGHGFAVTPGYYWRLLRAWTLAGYVVAAPIFPLENQNAPGGPNEADLINQPRDMSFVITRMLALSAARGNFLSGRINRHEIAVSGQSDGGETALAVAYDRRFLDLRIRAAAILSGAQIPGSGLYFPRGSPPLLATQGTADAVNNPIHTYAFFSAARRPKYLLRLFGAPHLPPYTYEQPQLSLVSRVSTAFFDLYLKRERHALARMRSAGDRGGVAGLTVQR